MIKSPRWFSRSVSSLLLGSLLAGSVALAETPEITVYNQNFALVKDYQTLNLKHGVNTIEMDSVAALIDPTSVHFKSLTAPTGVTVEEQNFRYDLINKSNILNRMVGQRIRFMKDNVMKEGILLNPPTTVMRPQDYFSGSSRYGNNFSTQSTSEFAVKTSDGILLTTLNDILIDQLPSGLYPRPTLVWDLFADKGGAQKSEVSYLTDGLNWWVDYVAVLSADDNKVDLTGWVTLDNQSGATYPEATLKLVAGDVRKLQNQGGNTYAAAPMMAKSMMMEDARREFKEESFFEYHLYTLNQKTTLADKETKQLSLISANEIPVTKKYIFDPDRNGGYYPYNTSNRPGEGGATSQSGKVSIMVNLKNSKDNNLGIPLPKGRVRLNKADSSGMLQFVGEDQIDHTAQNESIELYVGDAFDIVGDKKRTLYREDGNSYDSTYQVTVRNHKKQAVTVNAYQHLYGDWRISGNSQDYKKEDAQTVSFPVSVPAGGETTVTYTVHVKR